MDTDKETKITFSESGPSSSSVLQTLQEDDSFDNNNSCLLLRTPLEDSFVTNLIDQILQNTSKDFSSVFSGVSFFLPAGKGEVKLDIRTYGLQLSVHVGNAVAHLTQNERGEAVVQYDIPEPTLVCMHAISIELGGVAGRRVRQQVNDAEKKVELYGIKILPSQVVGAGVSNVYSDDVPCTKVFRNGQLLILRDGKMYTPTGAEVK